VSPSQHASPIAQLFSISTQTSPLLPSELESVSVLDPVLVGLEVEPLVVAVVLEEVEADASVVTVAVAELSESLPAVVGSVRAVAVELLLVFVAFVAFVFVVFVVLVGPVAEPWVAELSSPLQAATQRARRTQAQREVLSVCRCIDGIYCGRRSGGGRRRDTAVAERKHRSRAFGSDLDLELL